MALILTHIIKKEFRKFISFLSLAFSFRVEVVAVVVEVAAVAEVFWVQAHRFR